MKRWGCLTGLGLLACAASAQAEVVDFSVGNDSFRLGLNGPLSRVLAGAKGEYDTGVVLRERNGRDAVVVHGGILLTGDAGFRDADVAAGLGLRAVYLDHERDSGAAVALGGQLLTRFPGYDRVGFSLYGYFAPDATSFGRVGRYHELGGDVDYQLLKDASVYVGYREIRATFNREGKVKADDSVHAGLRLKF